MGAAAECQTGGAREPGGGYREKYRDYAVRYGSKERTVKRWVAIGREKGDVCPLDEPEAMAGWWTRHMKQRVPERILRHAPLFEMPKVATKAEAAPVDEPPPVGDEVPVNPEDVGLERTLERLERMEVVLARKADQPGQAKVWLDTVARIGPVAQRLREEQERLRKLIPRDEAEQQLVELLQPVEREIRHAYRDMCEAIGMPPSPEREEAWHRTCDRIFERLGTEVFR